MAELRPAQRAAVPVLSARSTLLLADVGSGKTATALRTLRARRAIHGRQRTLVLGTKRICESVWGAESAIWTPEFTYANVAGLTATKRAQVMTGDADIVGLNFDNLLWACATYGSELPRMFPQLIVDESSKLENPRSKSFKAIKPLLPEFQWRMPMTATPRANHLSDIWGNVFLADCGEALGVYYEAFLQCWFRQIMAGDRLKWVPRPLSEDEIFDRIERVAYRMPFTSPAPVEIDILLPLDDRVKAINEQIDKELKEECDSVCIDGISYVSRGRRKHVKQLQLSAGFIYRDDGTVLHLHSEKLEALREIVAEAHGEPMMVIFQFDHERDAILEAFPQAKLLDGDATLAAWNAGEIEILLIHPLSAGHGLNAQFSGSDLQVWFTPTTDAELYTQVIGRMNRPGAAKAIRVMRLIMRGTKDMACYMLVAARQRGEIATLEMFENE